MGIDAGAGGIRSRLAARSQAATNVTLAFFHESYVASPNNSTFIVKELPIFAKPPYPGKGKIMS
jgi:hypothetical protein